MQRILLTVSCTLAVVSTAMAEFADYYYLPPESGSKADGPVPEAVLADLLDAPRPLFVVDDFAGMNATLKAAAENPALEVAVHTPVEAPGEALFGEGQPGLGGTVYMADLMSADAYAVRFKVDLRGLPAGTEVYAVDVTGPRAFGPFTAADGVRWLPTLAGDTGALLVVSPDGAPPELRVASLAHFYQDLAAKALPCPAPVACGTDPMFQEVSTGVGRLLVPVGYGAYLCTATLLNNPDTPELEPVMFSAHHCFDGDVEVSGIEVFWDYRTENCDGTGVPTLPSVPRSAGRQLLAHSTSLDAEFFAVGPIADDAAAVPNGEYGRAWLGWDTRALALNDSVSLAHHPTGTPMKMCRGRVTSLNVTACLAGVGGMCSEEVSHQTQVHWDEGITEQGSSGSSLLLTDYNYRVVGALSNGPVHNCSNPSQNYDNFASFSRFYPQIQCYLREGVACEPGDDEDSGDNGGWCVFKSAFGNDSAVTQAYRALRDQVLGKSGWTRPLVEVYYKAAPAMSRTVEACPLARMLFSAGAAHGAAWIHRLGVAG